jgi:hypothetical protein
MVHYAFLLGCLVVLIAVIVIVIRFATNHTRT